MLLGVDVGGTFTDAVVALDGRLVKAVGTAARKSIEASTGRRCHLDLRVQVRRGWRGDESLLDRLGIE